MPRTKSVEKALKQSEKKRIRNLRKKREIKLAVKNLQKALNLKDKEAAEKYLKESFKKIDKASKTFIHKNKASRLKSRLSKRVNKALK